MIAPALVAEVRRLLDEGHSQRSIAQLTGVSRGTIGTIASGRRPDYETLRPTKNDDEEPLGPPQRCPSCGGMVYMPCRLCRLGKAYPRVPQRRMQSTHTAEWPRLDLRPEHCVRYEEVREWRRQAAANVHETT